MLGFGILNKLEQTRKGGAHKAPYLYSFDLEKYQEALKEGLKSGW
jgi:8-oxo-dGTP diphosphatase